jgi:assimilatory nitrate reductase catalytic subunit
MAETRSTCPYCGVGCGVVIEHDGVQITGVRGDTAHPANFGRLCTKGSTLHLTAAAHLQPQVRVLQPMARPGRGLPLQPLGWGAALDAVADRLATIVERDGPDAVGLYLSGQLLTEDYYVFNKLAKGLLGTNNVDTNSRLCMSSAVAGYKQTLGADAPPACYDDLAHAQTVFVTGSNMAWTHPVLLRRLEDARRADPARKLVVVDPRRTETAAMADLHLQILPGSDVVLHHAMLHLMLWEGLSDPAFIAVHTSGFDALRDRVRDISPAQAARHCGVAEADIVQAARWFSGLWPGAPGERRPTLSLYCQGLNQSTSGTDKNTSLINLHLASGQIGKPGAGPFSLTGQPNAMGGREVGGLSNLLSAHRDLANPAHRAEVAALWGLAEVPARPGLAAVQMFEAAADGALKALWIVCTNPAQSLPDQATVERALQRAELVVVQEAYATTATAAHADVLLPAASWGEKEGTVTNSERRISRVRRAVPPPGQAREDWRIAVEVARRLEQRWPPRRADGATLFPYDSAEQVWNEHRHSTRGRDLDIGGLSWALLDEPRQWPCPEGQAEGRARLYTDGRFATPDGRARFIASAPRPLAEPRDARYPLSLTTGRLRDQWHGGSRTGTLGRLFAHSPEPALELHPQELARRHWVDGELVRVRSRRGELVLPVRGSETVAPAQAFMAMHWGDEWLAGGVNRLTVPACCPHSLQPELKHTAVQVEAAALPWQLMAAAWLPEDQAMATLVELRRIVGQVAGHDTGQGAGHLASRFGYVCIVPFGREPDTRVGVLLRAAAAGPLPSAPLANVEQALRLAGPEVLRYVDSGAGQRRAMRLSPDGTLQAFMLAGDAGAQGWLLPLLQKGGSAATFGRALLSAGGAPPLAMAARSPQVCACFDVDQGSIQAVLARTGGDAVARLGAVQRELRCGTQCGSCLPSLRMLARQTSAQAGPVMA